MVPDTFLEYFYGKYKTGDLHTLTKEDAKIELINAIKEGHEDKLIIAEDLGDITDEVRELVEESGFPGMRVFQFGFLGGETPHKPHNYINNCIAYSQFLISFSETS